MHVRYAALVVFLLCTPLTLAQQKKPPRPVRNLPGDVMFDAYLKQETAKLGERIFEGAKNRSEWEKKRPQLKEQYLDMLGLWPLPERTPLNAVVTGTVEKDNVRVEKLYFQSKPGLYVTANLYLPKKVEGKIPAILYVCGHTSRGAPNGCKTVDFFQRHGLWYANNGYAFMIVDTLEAGEIRGVSHRGTNRNGRWWWQAIGYTPAGVECWNGIRALDYLQSRPEVDPNRLGVTGISGGGATTLWIAAADERIKAAVLVAGFTDSHEQISEFAINTHCDCMFMVNTYGWELTTVPALMAPRPLLIINSSYDKYFPMPGNERVRARLEKFYQFFVPRARDLFDVGVTPGDHALQTPNYVGDHPEQRLMAFRWFNRHFKKNSDPVRDPVLPVFKGEELRVFADRNDMPTDAINQKIDEMFIPHGDPKPPENAAEYRHWREELIQDLRTKVFRDWPELIPAATIAKPVAGVQLKDNQFLLSTEPGITATATRLSLLSKSSGSKDARSWLIVLNPDDPTDQLPEWAKALVKDGYRVLLLSPRGGGGFKWTHESPPNYIERATALLGRTVDTDRVRDIQATARWLQGQTDSKSVRVAGQGRAGILGAYAAIWEPAIAEVVAVDPPSSHRDGPIFLNVLRILDIADALGLLTPKPLTLINARDKAFERTGLIYKAAGVQQMLRVE